MRDFVVEHIGEALQKNQWKDIILELRRVEWSPDGARCVPQPRFERRYVEAVTAGLWDFVI
jgi:hypothetical protein